MSKRKEGIKELKLIGAAMDDLEVASELVPLEDKFSNKEQAVPSFMNQSKLPSQNQFQEAQMQSAQLFEHLAQQAKEQLIKVKNLFN